MKDCVAPNKKVRLLSSRKIKNPLALYVCKPNYRKEEDPPLLVFNAYHPSARLKNTAAEFEDLLDQYDNLSEQAFAAEFCI
ncbi:MAG: hypothetical protein J1F33_07090 [Clostridiales bacterium]|nr:hypothetical protein [Clostridiales bacterium]